MFASENIVYAPELYSYTRGAIHFFIDTDSPNWISTNDRGAAILKMANNKKVEEIASNYSKQFGTSFHKAWVDTCNFLAKTTLAGITSHTKNEEENLYTGRHNYLKTTSLNEFWIHLNDNCNLTCNHCLVDSAPEKGNGLAFEDIVQTINQTAKLGVKRYYITGGEPFVRSDLFAIIKHMLKRDAQVIIMTNGTLITDKIVEDFCRLDKTKIFFQISIDGVTPEINNAIRGKGFESATNAVKILRNNGFEVSIASAVLKENLEDLPGLPLMAKNLGSKSIHLLWPLYRGRITKNNNHPSEEEFQSLFLKVSKNARKLGVSFDNYESLKNRINRKAGIKFDLGNQCWDSLCLYTNGHIFPSAAFAGVSRLDMGSINEESVELIWKKSEVAEIIREESTVNNNNLSSDPFRFILGGPDIELSYFYSLNKDNEENFLEFDQSYALKRNIAKDIMYELSITRKKMLDEIKGNKSPILYFNMGENALLCGDDAWDDNVTVSTTHSNCVLSFDVERPHRLVQEFYSEAAQNPQADLCCPVKYDENVTSHIPVEVLERFYGCGSPIVTADVAKGEVVVDLGSGAGIDCFIAAKQTGEQGRVIGVDMTDDMLKVAKENRVKVAKNLGFDNIEFKKGFLEDIPVDSNTVDLITSNCVINLSVNKKKVFEESFRILKNGGRFVVSDIVSDKQIPSYIRVNKQLWGECLSGSLLEIEFLHYLEASGFYGVELLSKTFWKNVDGYDFYSITVRAFKQEKSAKCNFQGKCAVYHGPFQSVIDEEGHVFNKHEPLEICSDTENRLKQSPYSSMFSIIEKNGNYSEKTCSPVSKDSGKCC